MELLLMTCWVIAPVVNDFEILLDESVGGFTLAPSEEDRRVAP